jgi:radical SAM superfamily enzyme YgiQ (UPF0313 family)
MLFFNEDRVKKLCEAIIDSGIKIKLRGASRIDVMDKLHKETWEIMLKAGVIGISTGVESGSQRIRNYINKRFTIDTILSVDKKLTDYKLFKTYFFMTCVPTETITDIKKTVQLILKLSETSRYCPFPFGQLHNYIPLPGTVLYKRSIENGFIEPKNLDEWTKFTNYMTEDNFKITRPWMNKETVLFAQQVNKDVFHLNSLFKGKDRNDNEIDVYVDKLKRKYG